MVFGAFLNPVTAAGGAEVERKPAEMSQAVGWSETARCFGPPPTSRPEPGRRRESAAPAGEEIYFAHDRGSVAAATTEHCEVAL